MGEKQRAHIDRAYTIEEISTAVNSAADQRMKLLVPVLLLLLFVVVLLSETISFKDCLP